MNEKKKKKKKKCKEGKIRFVKIVHYSKKIRRPI